MMMMTLLWSAPAMLNVGAVLLMFMFIYAIIGGCEQVWGVGALLLMFMLIYATIGRV